MTAFTVNAPGAMGSNGVSAPLEWGAQDYGNSTSARFLYAWNNHASGSSTEAQSEIVVPVPGTLRNLRALADAITPTVVYTIRVNGVDTTITLSLATLATSGLDSAHTAALAQGDVVTLKTVTSSADSNVVYPGAAVEFVTS